MKLLATCCHALAGALLASSVCAEGLTASRLAVVFNADDAASVSVAHDYALQRGVPPGNLIDIRMPDVNVLPPEAFASLRAQVLDRLPSAVQSLLLVWSRPYAVGCMSVTTAFAAGYHAEFCPSGCARTPRSPLFDSQGWLPADTAGWWPAMLLPSADPKLAHGLIQRAVASDYSAPRGVLYLISTTDSARNVRAANYPAIELMLANRLQVVRESPGNHNFPDAIGYFTGASHVDELAHIQFRPGALADHLTSTGGILEGGNQMPVSAWLKQGATASYGSVSEPCSFPEKFPDIGVLFEHYIHGETVLESYWKSVAMPGQGLVVGEPLARPYAFH